MSYSLKKWMPEVLEHEGIWEGEYQHVDMLGNVIDRHASRIECIFPTQGDVVYIQRNSFKWPDGREFKTEFSGTLDDGRIWWDTDTFSGYGWQASPNTFLLQLDRKDIVGASFTEVIVMGESKRDRARTWHWFQDGACFKRTLCNERLIVV